MGLGPTATVGFRGPDGEWVAVSPTDALPVRGTGGGGGGDVTKAYVDAADTALGERIDGVEAGAWTPPAGTNGQVLKYDADGNLVPGTDNNTTYTEISSAEITAGTASTARAISGRRTQEIVDKARTDMLPVVADSPLKPIGSWFGTQAELDAITTKNPLVIYKVVEDA